MRVIPTPSPRRRPGPSHAIRPHCHRHEARSDGPLPPQGRRRTFGSRRIVTVTANRASRRSVFRLVAFDLYPCPRRARWYRSNRWKCASMAPAISFEFLTARKCPTI